MSCNGCDEIIQVGNSGTNGWSPILALYEGECDGDAVTVHQLISWDGGSGTRPSYLGDIMTDQWLIDNPIYLGSDGFVTDICEATPLNGGAGSAGAAGATGPEGPEGPAGCAPFGDLNFEFTNNGEPLTPAVDVAVTVDDTDPCDVIYDISIDASDLFTNPDLITALLDTTTFEDYINNLVATSMGGVNGINDELMIAKTGTPDVFFSDALDSSVPLSDIDFISGTENFFKWNILGNRMTLDFLLNIGANSNSKQDYLLQLKIPAGKTVYSVSGVVYPESNAVAVTTADNRMVGTDEMFCNNESLQGTAVITTYAAPKGTNYLLLGVTPNVQLGLLRTSDSLAGFNISDAPTGGYACRIQGQLTFTINT
jgi:hypothetical protein